MIHEVVIPVLDQTTTDVRLLNWLKSEGDKLTRGEVVCEIETDKATVEIEAPRAGVLRRILIEAATSIPPLTVVALVGPADEALPEIDPYYRTQPAEAAPAPQSTSEQAPVKPVAGKKVPVSPRARRLADELGVELAPITGTGPKGRILEDDVRKALQTAPAKATAGQRVARAMAERVTQSWTTIPHFHTTITVDMAGVVAAQAAAGKDFTFTDFIAQAVAQALAAHPKLNGYWKKGTHETISEIHIGLVVQTERGLVIPTLRDMHVLEFADLAAERAKLVSQAHAGKLSVAALIPATFTLSNMGPGNIDHFTAIISPPQVAILSVGSILPRPHVVNGDLAIQPTAAFSIGVDHRAIDGRAAAAFLETLKTQLEAEV